MKIGLGVTTYKRPKMLAQCARQIEKHRPPYSRLVIHDDTASGVGVARSKNRCIEMLMAMDCDHIFLFDDDTWPTQDGWETPYVQSPVEHLSYTWTPSWDPDRKAAEVAEGLWWTTANGCMLYFTRKAIETAGGMRTIYGKWGYEHLDLSWRIANMGLQDHPFISLKDQTGIYASDEHQEGISSVTPEMRAEAKRHGEAKYLYWRQKKEFVPYS